MLQDEKYPIPISIPIHQSGPSLNCPLVDNRCDHCGVSILAHPDIQMDEIMSSRRHEETANETTMSPPPPYQLIGDGTPHPTPVPSAVEGPPAPPRLEGDETQPSSALAASRRNRRRRRLCIRITLRFKIGSAREREKTVTFL
ncbi:unnamed protein product [Clonostachys byssicola]|uniref:Uncharacterized protein n=1 Tax=Clonostachys byssicola TaxID=160290 RepID=A0A9N9Y3T2_9HYPO|nr:unnamed protein product [Clonostachys byssicola]